MALELWTLHASRQCPHRAVRGRGHLFGWAHHPGVRKKRSPWLIFSHPSGVEEQLELRAGSAPNLPGTCLIYERRV